jgi:integrase
MSATVREKINGSGIWWVFIRHQGHRKSKKVGDKKTAAKIAKAINDNIVLKEFSLDEEPEKTFGHYADIWGATVMPAHCKPSTQKDYLAILKNHILPEFRNTPVSDVKRMAIKSFLLAKLNTKSRSTVRHMKSTLSGVFHLAMDDEAIQANPAINLGKNFLAQKKDSSSSSTALTQKELSDLLASFREHYPRHYPLALTLARTGLRIGEALALTWEDIDLGSRLIRINKNFVRGEIGTPKNGKIRYVDMSIQLTATLTQFRNLAKKEALRHGRTDILSTLVFPSLAGTPLAKENWRRRTFLPALEKAKVRRIRIHDMRHTYATHLIQADESLAYVRDQLGHHSISVTVDIYGHLVPGGNKSAVDKLDDVDFRPTLSKR